MKFNEIYYCRLTERICLVLNFDIYNFGKTVVVYSDNEKSIKSRIVKVMPVIFAKKYWVRLGEL